MIGVMGKYKYNHLIKWNDSVITAITTGNKTKEEECKHEMKEEKRRGKKLKESYNEWMEK